MVNADALLTVLENAECQELLRAALEKSLRENPLTFYKEIIMPRSNKLVSLPSGLQEFVKLTPAQEAKMMDRLTTGFLPTRETKVMVAEDFLERIFDESEDKEISSQAIFNQATEEGINSNSVFLAAKNLNINRRREGRRKEAKSFWSLADDTVSDKGISVRRA